MRKRRLPRVMKTRKNPIFIPIMIGAGIIGLLGVGTYVYASIQESEYSSTTFKVYYAAIAVLKEAEKGAKQEGNYSTAPGAAAHTPKDVGYAWALNAYWIARAAEATGDESLIKESQRWLEQFGQGGSAAHKETDKAQLEEILLEGASFLQNYKEKYPEVFAVEQAQNRLYTLSDPKLMQANENSAPPTSEDIAAEFFWKTGEDILRPASTAAALWTGKKPLGTSDSTWLMLRIGVYGGLSVATLMLVRGYISPFLPKPQQES